MILKIFGTLKVLIVEIIGGFPSLSLVVASRFGNEFEATNNDVLRTFVASLFGRWFMVPIFVFNINNSQPLSYLCSCITISTTFWFNRVVGGSQWRPLPTFVHIEYKSMINSCLVRGHLLLQPPTLLSKCNSCFSRIGSLEISLVCYMSNLKCDHQEPVIMITYRNWDMIVRYRLFVKE